MVRSICEIFLTVDGYIMDERPEHSLCLLREPAITGSNAVACPFSDDHMRAVPPVGGGTRTRDNGLWFGFITEGSVLLPKWYNNDVI